MKETWLFRKARILAIFDDLDKIKLRRQGREFREASLPVLEELFDDILQTFRNLAPMQDGPESLEYHVQRSCSLSGQ